MTLDYQECTLNGRPAIELFCCETGEPLPFVAVAPGDRAVLTAIRAGREWRAGLLEPNAIVAEMVR